MLAGPRCEPLVIDTAPEARQLGVEFRPGGARPFLGLPVGELANRRVDLADLVGRAASGLREQLQEAGDEGAGDEGAGDEGAGDEGVGDGARGAEARFRVVEEALLRWLGEGQATAPHPAVREAVRRLGGSPHATSPVIPYATSPGARVARIAADVGLSPRRFTQVFQDAVGLTPKRYGRVRRFREVLRRVAGRRETDWAGLAAASGYYDQPHLIREFVALAGVTPVAYLQRRGAYENHVRLS